MKILLLKFLLISTSSMFVGCDITGNKDKRVITKRFGFSVYTTDMTPIKITIQEASITTKFLIPKAYFEKSLAWNGGAQDRFILSATTPDMSPYALDKIYGREDQSKTLFIFIENDIVTDSYPDNAYKRIQNFKRIGELSGLEAYREEGRPRACYRIDLVESSNTADPLFKELKPGDNEDYLCWPHGDEYYVTNPSNGSRYIEIKCPPLNGMNQGKKCTSITSFENWRIKYMFYSPNRANWEYYDKKVQFLLSSLKL